MSGSDRRRPSSVRHQAVGPRLLDHFVEERLDAGVLIEEGVDVALRFAALDLEVPRQGELGLAVDNGEVHRLGLGRASAW